MQNETPEQAANAVLNARNARLRSTADGALGSNLRTLVEMRERLRLSSHAIDRDRPKIATALHQIELALDLIAEMEKKQVDTLVELKT